MGKRCAATLFAAALCVAALPAYAAGGSDDEGRWVPSHAVKPQGLVQLSLFEDGTAFAYNTNDTPFWRSSDSGTSWIPLPPPPNAGGTPQVGFASPDLGYTLSGGTIFVTEDQGLTWTEMGEPPVPQRHDSDNRFPSAEVLEPVPGSTRLIVGGHGFYVKDGCPVEQDETLLWVGEDSGRTWRFARIPIHGFTREVEFKNHGLGLALLYEMEVTDREACGYGAASARSSVLLTDDGGRSYEEIFSSHHADEDAVTSVAIPTRDRIVLGMGSGRILLSTNGGRSFRKVARLRNQIDQQAGTGTGFSIDSIEFGTPRIGYAGTNGLGTWRTEDGGETWFLEPSHQSLAGLNIGSIAAVGPDRALAGGAWAVARRVTD